MHLEKLRFPIGEFSLPENVSANIIELWIKEIEDFPTKLNELAKDLDEEKLNKKYRPDGWTIKQVIHHCADSHINSFVRFKLALTEDLPTIRPYFEDRWAELPDSHSNDISDSMQLIHSLHKKWVLLLKSLNEEQLKREFLHPETNKKISLKENIGIYAWHCNHHLAHIQLAIKN